MHRRPLPALSPLDRYEELAHELLRGLTAADHAARALFRELHPRFRRADVPWLVDPAVAEPDAVDLADARLAVARGHQFQDWDALVAFARAVGAPGPVRRFEAAADAVVDGDLPALEALLGEDPALARARSTRITCFDPPAHRATLLHYVAANGVEHSRQRTPPNLPEIAAALLRAGAEPDATADFYGEPYTTMALLVSSSPPAEAGVLVPVIEVLVAGGASVEDPGPGLGTSPLLTALVFGQLDAARALARLGAEVRDLPVAAGLGDAEAVARFLPSSTADERHRALAVAAQLGQVEVVRRLLDAGEDPSRYQPAGFHAHTTPLHAAALAGNEELARLLVERGASLEAQDRIYDATPAGWAEHAGHTALAAWLRSREGD